MANAMLTKRSVRLALLGLCTSQARGRSAACTTKVLSWTGWTPARRAQKPLRAVQTEIPTVEELDDMYPATGFGLISYLERAPRTWAGRSWQC